MGHHRAIAEPLYLYILGHHVYSVRANLGSKRFKTAKIISFSVDQELSQVKKSPTGSSITSKNVILTSASNFSNQELQVDDRHHLQHILPKPDTKLGGGKDACSLLVNHNGQGCTVWWRREHM